jgi:hypothetical protein
VSEKESVRLFITASLATAVVGLFLFASPATTAATKPRLWQWTPTKVVTRLKAASPLAPADVGSDVLSASCRGLGKAVAGRFARFTCETRWGGQNGSYASTLTIRILAIGSGRLCVVTTADGKSVPHIAGTQGTRIKPERACPHS